MCPSTATPSMINTPSIGGKLLVYLCLGFHNTQFPFLSACLFLLYVVIISETPSIDLYSLKVLTPSRSLVYSIVAAQYLAWDMSNQQQVKAE